MKTIILNLLLLFVGFCANAQISLPHNISDGMVLQQKTPITISGKSLPDENIKLNFIDASYSTTSDNNGIWKIKLPALNHGGPFKMTIMASDTVTINDILIGEVWLCSGQSNMELPVNRVEWIYPGLIQNATNDNIRYFCSSYQWNFHAPQQDVNGSWVKVSPQTVGKMSALCYFFACKMYQMLNVPIGIVNSALGGSPIASWIPEEDLKSLNPYFISELNKMKNDSLVAAIEKSDRDKSDAWYAELYKADKGYSLHWENPATDISDWQKINIPCPWKSAIPDLQPGTSVWFTKKVNFSQSQVDNAEKLILGVIVDSDEAYINGVKVGSTSYCYPPRRYQIDKNILKAGENTITVRALTNDGNGEFVKDKNYIIQFKNDTLDLSGEWLYKIGAQTSRPPSTMFTRWKPAGLYNGMIAPHTNIPFAGVVWYQGESDAGNAVLYQKELSQMISAWRREFKNDSLSFVICQLPNFLKVGGFNDGGPWAELRDVQQKVAQQTNSGLVCAIDLGEWNDIHPLNKKELGNRVAAEAGRSVYNIASSSPGPVFKSAISKKNKMIISFDNAEGLHTNDSDQPRLFFYCRRGRYFFQSQSRYQRQ